MANEEIKKIITIEVNGQTTVKDLKNEISSLRDALLNTQQGTDSYKQIVDQLIQKETQLTEVMAAGKTEVEAAEGSYNSLTRQMAALKKVWKQVNDEAARNEIGEKIVAINDQLKEMDASIGNYQRNVGNYSGAIEDASKAILSNLGNINPSLGKLGSTINSLIPLIKKTTTIATTGLKGIKAAIASTGIGLLIVALGEVLANWDKIAGAVKKVLGLEDDLVRKTREAREAAKDIVTEFNNLATNTDNVYFNQRMHSQSMDDEIAVINGQITEYEALENAVERANEAVEREDKLLKKMAGSYYEAAEQIGKVEDANNEKIAKIEEKQDKASSERRKKRLEEKKESLKAEAKAAADGVREEYETVIGGYNKQLEAKKKAEEELQKAIDARNLQAARDRKKEQDDAKAAAKAAEQAAIEAAKNRADAFNGAVRSLEDYLATEREKVETWYAEQYAIVSKDGDALALLEEVKKKKIADIDEKENKERVRIEEQGLANIRDTYEEGSKAWLDADIAYKEKIVANIEELGKQIDEADVDYEARLARAKKDLAAAKGASASFDTNASASKTAEAQRKLDNDALEAGKSGDRINGCGYWDDSMAAYDARIEAYKNYRDNLLQLQDETDEEYRQRQIEADRAVVMEERAQLEQRINNHLEFSNALGSMAGSIGDFWEECLKAQVENGKKSQKQAEKEFEGIKALQISEATINTISGAIAAFMGCQSLGQPWGAIIGAVQAAAVTAAGVAEIAKISNTKFGGSTSSLGGGMSAGASVTPIMTDYEPNYNANITSQTETENLANALASNPVKAYVVESEVTAAQSVASQRQTETSF